MNANMDTAKQHPECKHAAGQFAPLIDRNRCEGKADCVTACPCAVFDMGVLPKEQRYGLSLVGKLKGYGHGWRQAFAVRADACEGCGLCVVACPEKAIKLVRAA